MFDIIKHGRWYLSIAGVLVALSITALVVSAITSGLPVALDTDTTAPRTIQAAGIAALVTAITVPVLVWWLSRGASQALRWGASAVVILAFSTLVLFGFYALMGMLAGWQADTLFFVAVLVVIGLAIQDVIPFLSRIRENTLARRTELYRTVVSRSVLERFSATLATRLCAIMILVALLLVGDPVVLPLAATLLVGLVCATYSSIFVAPVLVTL
jgi:preprotein translocase subunit SecF